MFFSDRSHLFLTAFPASTAPLCGRGRRRGLRVIFRERRAWRDSNRSCPGGPLIIAGIGEYGIVRVEFGVRVVLWEWSQRVHGSSEGHEMLKRNDKYHSIADDVPIPKM